MKRNMKVKVENPAHSAKVQLALFNLGYYWCGSSGTVDHTDAMYLFADDKYITYEYSDAVYFDDHMNEEHFLVNGEFVPKSYWTQPATETSSPVLAASKWVMTKEQMEALSISASPAPPLGLKPRKLHNEARIIDILEAMTRYVEAGKPIDQDWLGELNCLVMENQ